MNISGSKNQPVSEICTVREKSGDVIASENPYSGIVEVRTCIAENTNANTSDLLLETIERDNHCQTFENLQIDEDIAQETMDLMKVIVIFINLISQLKYRNF